MQTSYATITLAPGKGKARQYHVPQVESWTTEQSIDNDVDSFSVEIGDVAGELLDAIDRDTEVRVNLFATDGRNRVLRVFTGLVDVESFSKEKTHTMQGSDVPSAILIGTDAVPGYWRHVDPKALLTKRGKALGLANMKIAPMRQIGRLWSDASEKEWSFWYRVARTSGHFMWSDDFGALIIDNLNYSRSSWAYNIGHPKPGTPRNSWIQVLDVNPTSNKQQRLQQVTVYGEDKKKKGVVPIATANNPSGASIAGWLRRPVAISTLATAKTQKDLDDEAKLQVFESIVGAQEHTLVIGNDVFVQQNEMARINLPEYGIVGVFYVVGVSRSESSDGLTQTLRLREPGYAIDKRVPQAPTLSTQPNTATGTSTANIAESLSGKDGIRWSGAFVRATREFLSGPGTPGWDFSVALGVLLAICYQESKFRNVRESGDAEWHPMPTNTPDQSLSPSNPFDGRPVITAPTLSAAQQEWRKEFANAKGNSLNPFPREAGVGPMQLTTLSVKQWADAYGWSGSPPMGGTPEYAGGRWNPESNIRAAARLLAEDLKEMGADPTNSETIWSGVAAYNAGVAGAKAGGGQGYAAAVRKVYKSDYGPDASSAVTSVQKTIPGSAQRVFKDGSGNVIVALPDNTPATVAKAITWAMSQRGNKYQWGGSGQLGSDGKPRYDCSSFVTHAMVVGDPNLKFVLDEPIAATGHHGETTFSLWAKGMPSVASSARVPRVSKSDLLPGDLVFFNDDHGVPEGHVGMFIGDGQFIHDPNPREVVKVSSLNESYYRDNYNGALRFFSWAQEGPHAASPSGATSSSPAKGTTKKVMIQAGHLIPSGESDEPYGHSGETGASGEIAFNTSIRDKVLALMSSDPRFDGVPGNAWSASAGATSSTSDDVKWDGDMFISVHYSIGTPGSGFLFGYTRGSEDGRSNKVSDNSAKLADSIATEVEKISGAPGRYTDNTHFGEGAGDPVGASGWGYYAWGSDLRAAPEDRVDYTPGVPVKLIFECGFEGDAHFLNTQHSAIARAIYRGICSYYGFNPVGK